MGKPTEAVRERMEDEAPPSWRRRRIQNLDADKIHEDLKPLFEFLGMSHPDELGDLLGGYREPVVRGLIEDFRAQHPADAAVPWWKVKRALRYVLRVAREANLIRYDYADEVVVAGRVRVTFWVPVGLDQRVRREAAAARRTLSSVGEEILEAGVAAFEAKRKESR